ncbi:MRS7 family protein [Cryptococcus deuterogattii 99/473]|uniref:Mitochondrial proton/calcium exchanger protein n=2 Tax=Cryptococcus deuterogattii TaxID=1859096 RepID=A0A0D0VB25_9TREE|nr:MRS7 family protein [Cryptococcus deuterogattii Ram5]KIR97913.1 MRS7 family protein [Cryptococcus deuterogattii 2001/935-1]KIY54803.1 MRS7 family protein [Cryptococcus deuterogattii 99/473]
MSASTTTAYARLAPPHALVRGAPLPLRLRHPAHLAAVRSYVRSSQAFTSSAPVPLATLAALRTTRPQLLQLVPLASVRYVSTQPQESSLSPHSYPPPLQPQATAANRINLTEPAIGTPPPLPPTPQGSLPPKVTDLAASHEKAVEKEDEKKKPTGPLPARVWASVKKEAAHYWAGTKLLGQEIKISGKLQWKVLNGGTLTRRERRQLRRTTIDLLRLLPFSVFIVVPFMELLLPVALKLFPNMLPSTFEGEFAANEKQRKLLRVRIEMAKFLQETVRESGLKADSVVRSDEFKEFFRKVRSTGETPNQTDVVRVAKLFHDDITLDNLSRSQLVSMCRYMNINAFGTDNFLKHQIRNKLEKVRVDDMMIHAEGVESLSTKELQQACQSRGIRFQGVSPARLREELEKWIELHYINGISGVLLVLSRAFNFEQKGDDIMESLVTTLSSLPENLLNEAELHVSDEASYKQKLEVLQQQQELIEDEAEQEKEEQDARKEEKEKKELEESARREQEEAAKAVEISPAVKEEEPVKEHVEEPLRPAPEQTDARMTKEQLSELAEALSILTAKSSIVKERDELKSLLEDNLLSEAESKERQEGDSPTVAVSKRVRAMIKKIDTQLEKYDEKVGSSLNVIQTTPNGQIALADLKKALKVIKHRPADDVIEGLGKKLDVDSDGYVELDHVVELTQDHGLGIVLEDEEAQNLLASGSDIRHSKDVKEIKPKREDILQE